jgi:hypothetical protein
MLLLTMSKALNLHNVAIIYLLKISTLVSFHFSNPNIFIRSCLKFLFCNSELSVSSCYDFTLIKAKI